MKLFQVSALTFYLFDDIACRCICSLLIAFIAFLLASFGRVVSRGWYPLTYQVVLLFSRFPSGLQSLECCEVNTPSVIQPTSSFSFHRLSNRLRFGRNPHNSRLRTKRLSEDQKAAHPLLRFQLKPNHGISSRRCVHV